MTMDVAAQDHPQTVANPILYSRPRTCKTYTTAYEAVRLYTVENQAKPLKEDRATLRAEYRDLVYEERIEFVAFNQSFSYENFTGEVPK